MSFNFLTPFGVPLEDHTEITEAGFTLSLNSTVVDIQSPAKSTNISPSTVSRINKRWREQHSLKDAPKSGRPSTINELIKIKLLISSLREDWSKIIWSDESKFKIFGSDGKQYYLNRPEEPLSLQIDGMMDAKLHQQILHGDLMNTIKDHGFNVKEVIFQQDGDHKHAARGGYKRW
ncbi:11823_t:CDS:2 [Entrophospora sp. SA101]|nr:11817_t:CDS:2 [Entrophospora sp. SA101]CAJ0903377.1 11823_t:CDS:2 [Entrophospora sp. SA101]